MTERSTGYFRTPIAAAMVCGVFAGAVSLFLEYWMDWLIRRGDPDIAPYICMIYLTSYISYALNLTAPAICQRRPRLFAFAWMYAVLVAVLQLGLNAGFDWLLGSWLPPTAIMICFHVYRIAVLILTTWLVTLISSRMYGLNPCPRRVHAMAILSAMLSGAMYWVMELTLMPPDGAVWSKNADAQAAYVMFSMLNGLIVAILPAIAIERALKMRPLVTFNADEAGNEPTGSPAEIHA